MRPLFSILLLVPFALGEDYRNGRYFVVTSNQVNGRLTLNATDGTYFAYAVHLFSELNKEYLRKVFVLDERTDRTGCSVLDLAASTGSAATELGHVGLKAEGGNGLTIIDDNDAITIIPPYVIYVGLAFDQPPVYSAARSNGQVITTTPVPTTGTSYAIVLNADPKMSLRRFNVTKDAIVKVFTQPYQLVSSTNSVLDGAPSNEALATSVVIAGPIATITTLGPASNGNNTASFELHVEQGNGIFATSLSDSSTFSVSSVGYAGANNEPFDVPRGTDIIPAHQEYAVGGLYVSLNVRGHSAGAQSGLNITIDGADPKTLRGFNGFLTATGATKITIDCRGDGVYNVQMRTGKGAGQSAFGLSLIGIVLARVLMQG